MPGVRPVTTPPALMLAVPVPFVIDHTPVPPEVVFVNAGVVELTHTDAAPPVIGDTTGNGFTVIVIVFSRATQLLPFLTATVTVLPVAKELLE